MLLNKGVHRVMDAITLEVMRNRFFAITEEMGAALIRTAYSTNIKDRRDCSCALFNVNGDTIAQAEHIPVHSGVLPWGVKGALKYVDMAKCVSKAELSVRPVKPILTAMPTAA